MQQLARYAFVDLRGVRQVDGIAHERIDARGRESQLYLRLRISGRMGGRGFLNLLRLSYDVIAIVFEHAHDGRDESILQRSIVRACRQTERHLMPGEIDAGYLLEE